MKRNIIIGFCVLFIIFAVSGCETVPKKFKEEVLGIRTRVETLETKVEGVEVKQEAVERATTEQAMAIDDLMKSAREKTRTRTPATNISVKPRVGKSKEDIRQIQACLKAAGFYDGAIDGVKGRKTRKAIRDFQETNGLRADGVVGPKTWALLSKYGSGGAEEGLAK